MPKSTEYRSSAVEFDGAAPLILQSGLITTATVGVLSQALKMVPWDAYIERAWYRVHTAAATSGSNISLGSTDDDDKYIDSLPILATSVGLKEINLGATGVITRLIPAGDFIELDSDAGAVAGAVISFTFVLVPRSAS